MSKPRSRWGWPAAPPARWLAGRFEQRHRAGERGELTFSSLVIAEFAHELRDVKNCVGRGIDAVAGPVAAAKHISANHGGGEVAAHASSAFCVRPMERYTFARLFQL